MLVNIRRFYKFQECTCTLHEVLSFYTEVEAALFIPFSLLKNINKERVIYKVKETLEHDNEISFK